MVDRVFIVLDNRLKSRANVKLDIVKVSEFRGNRDGIIEFKIDKDSSAALCDYGDGVFVRLSKGDDHYILKNYVDFRAYEKLEDTLKWMRILTQGLSEKYKNAIEELQEKIKIMENIESDFENIKKCINNSEKIDINSLNHFNNKLTNL